MARQNGVTARDRLSHFTWAWFECTMSTGAIATLLAQQPFGFKGLKTIGKIFFILDLVLFVTFTVLITARFFLFSRSRNALKLSLHRVHESFFFGAFWVSIALILYCIQKYAVASCGPWLVKALEVLFWTYAGCVMLVAVFQYHVIFDEEQLPVTDAMPVWILPAYPFLIIGPLASTIIESQPRTSALPMLIGGITFAGLGWTIAFFMLTLYVTRLVNSDLPVSHKRPGMYVAVGPAAYTSNALVKLGVVAPKVLPPSFLGIVSLPVGEIWKAVGVPAGIFFWLIGFWFFAVASVSNLSNVRGIYFTLNFWSFIFPNAGLTIALISIADVLDSDGIRGVCSAMTLLLVAAWLLIAGGTIRAVYRGQVLWPGKDEDEENIEGLQQGET